MYKCLLQTISLILCGSVLFIAYVFNEFVSPRLVGLSVLYAFFSAAVFLGDEICRKIFDSDDSENDDSDDGSDCYNGA